MVLIGTADFSARVTELFKTALKGWDSNNNILEWEGVTQQLADLFTEVMRGNLEANQGNIIRVGWRPSREDDPGGEAEIHGEFPLEVGSLDERYGDKWVDYKRTLSDTLILSNTDCDEGYGLALDIEAIRKSLEIAEQKAVALGWTVSNYIEQQGI
jgi:hypothetical protein